MIEYLTQPAQMLERARVVGEFPARPALYDQPELAQGARHPPAQARTIIEHAVPRPVTPVYTELTEILQIYLHRALTGQLEPAAALAALRTARCEDTLLQPHRAGLGEVSERAAR